MQIDVSTNMMSSPFKKQPEAVADRVLKRAEISKVPSWPFRLNSSLARADGTLI
jgi:hypothetical protein